MDLVLFEGKTELQQEAIDLHLEIRKNGEIAAIAMVEFAKGLKVMRDKHLYMELGFNTFEEYVEKAVGIRQRQAYNYIQALEGLGESFLQLNAKIGITKLQILTELSYFDREDFVANNNVEEMSVKELRETIKKLTAAEEQITFLTSENQQLTEKNKELSELVDDSIEVEDELDIARSQLREKELEVGRLESELKEIKKKPVPVSVREPSAEEIEELTQKAVEAERKRSAEKHKAELEKVRKEKDKAVSEAEAKSRKEREALEAKYKAAISSAEKERTAAADRLALVEKNAKISANPEVLRFSFYFEEVQKNIAAMKSIISKLEDNDTALKLFDALCAVKKLLDTEPPCSEPTDAKQQRMSEV